MPTVLLDWAPCGPDVVAGAECATLAVARDPADRKAFDRSPDIALARGAALQRQRIELSQILCVHQRPAHRFAFHDRNGLAGGGGAGETLEHAAFPGVDHRGVDDDAADAG